MAKYIQRKNPIAKYLKGTIKKETHMDKVEAKIGRKLTKRERDSIKARRAREAKARAKAKPRKR